MPAFVLLAALLSFMHAGLSSGSSFSTSLSSSSTSSFSASHSAAEAVFSQLASASNDSLRESLQYFTSITHVAGTARDKSQADYTKSLLQSYGISDVEILEYYPLLNRPISRSLTLLKPNHYEAELLEDVIEEDPTSEDRNAVPTFHGYGASGNVTAPLVYVNYGRLQDFEALRQRGVNVVGKIALVRYGQNFRGLKVRAAELAGCAGVIIYSDPADDGFVRGTVYPEGPYRPPSGVQRGSVQYNVLYAGDPLTPFVAAKSYDTERISIADANIPKIPSLPISYRDAEPLLKALVGNGLLASDLGEDWQGGLPFQYYTGSGHSLVHLFVDNRFGISPIWNVVGRIPGTDEVEGKQAVVVGNHRDAWTYGATDPSSGTAVLLETAKIFGQMLSSGWKPRRTIIFASWDAEEYGLVGSTEYAEEFAKFISETVIAYINVDVAVSGSIFGSEASPSLSNLVRSVTKEVLDPKTGKPLYDVWRGNTDEPIVGSLGAGSDYVPFLQHLGVSSINLGFSGPQGVYHSNYDSFHWMAKFGDPTFEYHAAMTQVYGLLALRLADSNVLPFDVKEYADSLQEFAVEVSTAAGQRLQLKALFEAIEHLRLAAESVQMRVGVAIAHDNREEVAEINRRLFNLERGFLDPEGLPGRPWFRHVVFAPGLWAGYESQVFPSIFEALNGDRIVEAQQAVWRIAFLIDGAATQFERV